MIDLPMGISFAWFVAYVRKPFYTQSPAHWEPHF